ncbi:MAG TPA: sensor histidine kinase [Thermoanaerobaculia bacterium]|nr:sensor histidine kinase [Thermoanaerobaculia bacterium]
MWSTGATVAIALAYVALLFFIAWRGDRQAAAGRNPLASPWIYALSLAVYCTAWTFYGSVGRAATDGYGFLPIYLGPTLACALGWVVYRKILRIAKIERLTSIADFLASRFGKSAFLGAVVAVVAVVGTVPYIALQLKAVATSFQLLLARDGPSALSYEQLSLSAAAVLALFAILFGTRSVDLTEQHAGLVLAIAFESLVKLVAFLAVGLFVVFGLYEGFGDLFARAAADPALAAMLSRQGASEGAWAWMTFLSLLAFWFLPRQFQVGIVENVDERHLSTSAWLLPLYLLVINVFVLPIALAGRMSPATAGASGDTFVLLLPLSADRAELAVLVFLGGLSAATSMVIVESLAISNMVANDLVLPVLLQRSGSVGGDFRQPLLISRRLAIVAVLLLGHLYAISAGVGASLISIGLVSFAAVAQLAPATLGGLYWAGATRRGALAGLIGGFAVWAYTLPLPSLVATGRLPASFLSEGPLGLSWLRPHALFGLDGLDPLSHSLTWSLLVNVVAFVGVSSLAAPGPVEERQARRFVDVFRYRGEVEVPVWSADAPVASLRALLSRFLGEERTERALQAWADEQGVDLDHMGQAHPELIAFAERLLAGTTGAASARVALASVAQEKTLDVGEVVELLDETSRVIAASRELAEKSQELETASAELRRVNEQLRELDRLKDDFLSTMAHELRTPLTAIRAFAEILHDNPELDTEKRSEFLRVIAKENERLSRLIHDLLDLARLEGKEERMVAEPVDLAEVVADGVAALDQLAASRGVEIEVTAPMGLPPVAGDRDRLIQVVINLVSNAVRFCPAATGHVAVSVQRRRGELLLGVEDNGPGVPPTEREAIFEKFRQIARPVSGRQAGTGLGLAITRRIVARHGGRIWVEDAAEGGALFLVSLPTRAADAPQPIPLLLGA